MDVERFGSRAAMFVAMAWAALSSVGNAGQFSSDERMRTIAPTVTQVSFSDCGACGNCDQSNGACCDLGCHACDGQGCGGCDGRGGCDACCAAACGSYGILGSRFGNQRANSTAGESGLLGFGLVKKSEPCFSDFISPMTNPVFFEDPRSMSELRFLFVSHELPGNLGGNSVQVYAMQVRARLTDRLTLIATKDGFIASQSPILNDGYADLNAGLKYNLYRNVNRGWLLSVGTTYEAPTGSNRSLQGNGNGEWNFFATGGMRLFDRWHVVSAMGIRQPNDENLENGVFYRSLHIDRSMGERNRLYLFTEFNWYNYLSSGNAFPLPLEGGDLFNFGSPNVTGNDLVTNAIGARVKPRRNISTGVAWEYPMTARKGILENRVTADLIIRY